MTAAEPRARTTGTWRHSALPLLGAGLALCLAGCGSAAGDAPAAAGHVGHGGHGAHGGTHVMPDGTRMSDSQMNAQTNAQTDAPMQAMGGMASAGASPSAGASGTEAGPSPESQPAPGRVTHFGSGPSAPAAMICSKETADAVRRTFALPADAPAEDGWRPPTYTCAYALPHGSLRLSVRDLRAGAAATAWFERLQRHAAGAHRIVGLQSLGLPAFEATGGRVGFLKDGQALVVDASGVPARDLPPGFSRTGVAYGVAAAVIACWSE